MDTNIFSILSKHHKLAASSMPSLLQQVREAESNAECVEIAYESLKKHSAFPNIFEDRKSDEKSEYIRHDGNELFRMKRNLDAVGLYTNSACQAKSKPLLALAYANRSAAFLKMGLIGECLRDIERALENDYPEDLKKKLIDRKRKATIAMKNYTPIQYHCPIPEIPSEHQNKLIECASDAIELKTTPDKGRHVVATRKIEIGEIIAIEKPFSTIMSEGFLTHCHECLELCYDLVPCENCTQTLYCSDACKKEAYKYHQYECKILLTLKKLGIEKPTLLTLRMALSVKELYESIANDSLQTDKDEIYRSNRYYEISKLETHTEKRSVDELLKRALLVAVLFRLVEKGTNFLGDGTSKTVLQELLLLHFQTCAVNIFAIYEVTPNEEKIYEDDSIASAMYSFMSMFNHACNPNIDRVFYGSTFVARAVETINKGEECCVSYGYVYSSSPIEMRRSGLKTQFFFECACRACKENWPMWEYLPTSQLLPRNQLRSLQVGNVHVAQKIWQEIAEKMKRIENQQPESSFFNFHKALKQCFALFGNVRRPVR